MKHAVLLLLLLPACVSCKSSSSSEVGVSQVQTNEQSQIQNESELDCNLSCSINATGLVTVIKDCQGGASSVVTVSALPDNCTSINEVGSTESSEVFVP